MENNRSGQVRETPVYDFSTLQWTGVSLEHMYDHLIANIGLISHHPEREAETLSRLLSRRLELKESQIIITEGATGALHLVAASQRGAKSMLLTPAYMEIRHALDRSGHEVTEVRDVKDLSKLEVEGYDFVWLSTPSSPDGRTYSRRSLLALVREHPEVVFVVDITMSTYLLEDTLKPNDARKYKNLVLISSFSKSYNLAGLRVGYLAASVELCEHIRVNLIPRSVSSLALEAARYVLLHPATFTIPIRKWHRESKELQQELAKIDGVEITPSSVPFFVMSLRDEPAEEVAAYLRDNHNILVATSAMDIDLRPNEMRVCALPKFELNHKLYKAILSYMKSVDRGVEDPEDLSSYDAETMA